MSRILITGATGALGFYLKQRLQNPGVAGQAEIFCLSRSAVDSGPLKNVHTIVENFLHQDSMASILDDILPTHVFHLAWETTHGTYWDSPTNTDWADATIEFTSRLAELGGRHLTFAGTCAEYQWGGRMLDEQTTPEMPATRYGQEKLRATHSLTEISRNTSLTVNCSRIFFPFSERENENRITTAVVKKLLRDEPFHMRAGDVYRDLLHTRHVAATLEKMATADADGVFNISAGTSQHLGSFMKAIARQLDKEHLLTWDKWIEHEQATTEPQYLVGNHGHVAPYLPRDIDMEKDINSFVTGTIERFA